MTSESFVHVIDDDAAARDSLAFLIKAAGMSVRTYESATQFLADAKGLSAGCIVTDVRMPEMSGIDLLKRLRASGITVPVIVMTGHGDIPLAVEAMKLGARDFFEKPFEDDALLNAVQACLKEQRGEEQRNAQRAKILECIASLSNRERQVLDGLVAGKANKVIAFDHGISPRTVEIYRANVMTKMNASTLSELVRMAILAGILDDGASA